MAKKPEKGQEIFTWKGTDRQGKKVTGEMEAQGPAYVRSTLRREGINPRSVRKKPKSLFSKKIKPKDISIAPVDKMLCALKYRQQISFARTVGIVVLKIRWSNCHHKASQPAHRKPVRLVRSKSENIRVDCIRC